MEEAEVVALRIEAIIAIKILDTIRDVTTTIVTIRTIATITTINTTIRTTKGIDIEGRATAVETTTIDTNRAIDTIAEVIAIEITITRDSTIEESATIISDTIIEATKVVAVAVVVVDRRGIDLTMRRIGVVPDGIVAEGGTISIGVVFPKMLVNGGRTLADGVTAEMIEIEDTGITGEFI